MQMFHQNKDSNKRLKKSHLLLIGSLFIFIGFVVLFSNYFEGIKNELFSQMRILMMESHVKKNEDIKDTPISENIEDNNDTSDSNNTNVVESNKNNEVDYSRYLGVLEIPRISLKRGFYNIDSKYNNIQYNVTLVNGSTMPDVNNGNLILMAHSGDAYISFFAYLYKLEIGDMAYVTYNGIRYKYQLVNIYNVDKVGKVKIVRNYDRTTLTLITCTKDDSLHQTVYIFELV